MEPARAARPERCVRAASAGRLAGPQRRGCSLFGRRGADWQGQS